MMGWFRRRLAPPVIREPAFSRPAPNRSGAERATEQGARAARIMAPGEAFTPTQPKTGRRRLIGREAELERIMQALQEDRAHVVLYSERGRGKTSLSNMVVEALRRSGTIVARHTCEAGTTFDDLMRGLMRDLPPSLLAARVGSGTSAVSFVNPASPSGAFEDLAEDGCVAALPAGPLRPLDVVLLPQRLDCHNLVCVVDEFDRIEDPSTRTRLADVIKQLSDRGVPLQFLIVGVSENLDQILGQHPSIQRAVLGVHLPLFTDRDVAMLIARGGREAGVQFPPSAVARITVLARGMPYMAQLLGLRLTQATKARDDTTVLDVDFEEAVDRLLQDAGPRVVALYAALTAHGRDAEMVLTLRRIASTPQDPWGRLQVTQEHDGGAIIGGRKLSALCWKKLKAAHILQPALPGSDLYLFGERGVMHHALLLAARDVTAADKATNVHQLPEPASEPAPASVETPAPETRAPETRAPETRAPETRGVPARPQLASLSRG